MGNRNFKLVADPHVSVKIGGRPRRHPLGVHATHRAKMSLEMFKATGGRVIGLRLSRRGAESVRILLGLGHDRTLTALVERLIEQERHRTCQPDGGTGDGSTSA